MIIDTSLYMPYQRELDERIFSTHQTNRENTRIDRTLALCVELSEFVNETRCFKYWSL
ncbi:MAG: dUTP diphosphatase, partial [Erysipelothrix sp.]|nr:dUTP diphosphatase [Erysipelothrix sp.]